MPVFTKWLKRLRPPLAPRVFPTTFPRIDASTKHVTLKVFIRDQDLGQHANNEINTYYKIQAVAASSSHPGRHAVRSVLDHLPPITSPAGDSHQCLVHAPLWDTARDLLYMNDTRRFTPLLTAMTLRPLLLALDFLHTVCRLVHTDIKADSLAYGIDPRDPVLQEFEQQEMDDLSPGKEVANSHYIYTSQAIAMPESLGYTIAHPRRCSRSPGRPPRTFWNVGCMACDLCQVGATGGHLFDYTDLKDNKYRSRVHWPASSLCCVHRH